LIEGRHYLRPEPFYLDLKNIDPTYVQYYESLLATKNSEPQDVNLFLFENAHVTGQGTVILGDNSLLLDSAAEFINHRLVPDGVQGSLESMVLPTVLQHQKGVSILVKRPWYRNYGHYLVDLMPILPALKAAGVLVDNIIYGDVLDPLREIMLRGAADYFPHAQVVFTDDTSPINFEKLLYVQPVHVPPLYKHPTAIEIAREAAKRMFPVGECGSEYGEKLYLSRQNVSTRRISNNAQVEEYLTARGFRSIYPEKLTIEEQISAFANARIILGPKGAAFTNVIFCAPGAHVLALSSSRFVDPFFWDLASLCRVSYSEIFCRSLGTDPATADFEVDISSIAEFLSAVSLTLPSSFIHC
jgi:capsular polysaccharide biosynthesis protein